jgi:hypothetical protein
MPVRRPFEKYFDKGLRGWIVDTARRNLWRMPSHIGLDDLISEGFLAYAITKHRYSKRVENKAHFMSLFKTVFNSIISNYANDRTAKKNAGLAEWPISDVAVPGKELVALEMLGGGVTGDQELALSLAKAPAEVQRLLDAVNDGVLTDRRFKHRKTLKTMRTPDGSYTHKVVHRETNNEFLNRMLGTIGYDYEGEVRALIM